MLDADEITPGLWQGSVPPRGSVLAVLGFQAVVLAAEEWQFHNERFDGVAVLRAPNRDDGSELTRAQLDIAIKAARQCAARIRGGQRVLSTCAAGVNRSGLVSALTMHFLHGWSGEKCIQRVRAKRKLRDRSQPLRNPYFTAALRQLEEVPTVSAPAAVRMSPGGIILPSPGGGIILP